MKDRGEIVVCSCREWNDFSGYIFDAQIFFSQNTGFVWKGGVWSFCPWCGKELEEIVKDEKVVVS